MGVSGVGVEWVRVRRMVLFEGFYAGAGEGAGGDGAGWDCGVWREEVGLVEDAEVGARFEGDGRAGVFRVVACGVEDVEDEVGFGDGGVGAGDAFTFGFAFRT